MTTRSTKYSPEVRTRAVRMVFEHRGEHASEGAAISSIASKMGCEAETLRLWVRDSQREQSFCTGPTTEERERIKTLEREDRTGAPVMTEDAPFLPGFSPVADKNVDVAFNGGRLTSDAGMLLLAEIERKLGLAEMIRFQTLPRSYPHGWHPHPALILNQSKHHLGTRK
jgi:transposase-like protein